MEHDTVVLFRFNITNRLSTIYERYPMTPMGWTIQTYRYWLLFGGGLNLTVIGVLETFDPFPPSLGFVPVGGKPSGVHCIRLYMSRSRVPEWTAFGTAL